MNDSRRAIIGKCLDDMNGRSMLHSERITMILAAFDSVAPRVPDEAAVERMKDCFRQMGLPTVWVNSLSDYGWKRALSAAFNAPPEQVSQPPTISVDLGQAAIARECALEEAARIADRNDMSPWGIAKEIRKCKSTSPNCAGTWPNRDNCGTCQRCLETAPAEVKRLQVALDMLANKDGPERDGLYEEVRVAAEEPHGTDPVWTKAKDDLLRLMSSDWVDSKAPTRRQRSDANELRLAAFRVEAAFTPHPACPATGYCAEQSRCSRRAPCEGV